MKLLALKHIPNHLHGNFNEEVNLSKLVIQPPDSQQFNLSHAAVFLKGIPKNLSKDSSEEYNNYRRQLGIVFNPVIQVLGYLNQLATGWNGDAYALVQRQKELSEVV